MASPRLTEPVLTNWERQSARGGPLPDEVDCDAVRGQVERILASAVFRNSKRYSSLLRHVVERALEGRPEDLKERNIGIDVFGRATHYDTNVDHVVRSVAGEVRRRLAQYYMEPGREQEIRIDLQAGSYVPQFRMVAERPLLAGVVAPPELPVLPALETKAPATVKPELRLPWLPIAAGTLAIIAVALLLAFPVLGPRTSFERFWSPVFSSSSPVLLCVGGGGSTSPAPESTHPQTVSDFDYQPSRRMHTSDALALAGLAGLLQSNGKPYRFLNRSAATSFRDLQSGPFILIGAMNNQWTLLLTSSLRFGFEKLPNGARVVDRQNPGNMAWTIDYATPLEQFNRDYAVVSRVRDPKTEQTVVIVAGIGSWGTLAAGEFVTNPENLKKLEVFAPKHWEGKNVQAVISTDVIRGSSGPPTVLAAHFF